MRHKILVWSVAFAVIAAVLFCGASFLNVMVSAEQYAEYTAESEIREMKEYIINEVEVISEMNVHGKFPDEKAAREEANELVKRIRRRLMKEKSETHLIILNSRYDAVYPNGLLSEGLTEELLEGVIKMIKDGELSPEAAGPIFREAEKRMWAFDIYEAECDHTVKTKFFIMYHALPDTEMLLIRYGRRMLVTMTACGILLGVILILYYKALKSLDRAEEEKELVYQNTSHDLKTPLESIVGYAEAIREQIIDPVYASGIIIREGMEMGSMIDNILLLSRLETSSWIMKPETFELNHFLEEETEALQGICGSKSLSFRRSSGNIMITADVRIMSGIIRNLVSNGIKYAAGLVMVECFMISEQIIISVRDDGPGIPEAELPYIFNRFYKGEQGQNGIGLSIAETGTHLLKGDIQVNSSVSGRTGTEFRVMLPCANLSSANHSGFDH